MKPFTCILIAFLLCTFSHGQNIGLVTDPSNNSVISGRVGALTFTNGINVNDTQITDAGLSWAGVPRIDLEQAAILDEEGNVTASWGYSNTSFNFSQPFSFNTGVATLSATALGLGTSNTPAFAGLTLTTLADTNGPNLVGSTTSGQLTNLSSVPSGGAPEGAVLTVVGGQYAGVASRTDTRMLATNSVRQNWGGSSFNAATNIESGFGTWTTDADSIYRIEYMMLFTMPDTNSWPTGGMRFPSNSNVGDRVMMGLGLNPGAALGVIQAASASAALLPIVATSGSQTNRWASGVAFYHSGTNSGPLSFGWTQNSTNATTLNAGSTISVTKIAP